MTEKKEHHFTFSFLLPNIIDRKELCVIAPNMMEAIKELERQYPKAGHVNVTMPNNKPIT